MSHRQANEGRRVLIVAPFGRDADAVAELLRGQGYDATPCRDLDQVADAIDQHIGVVVLTQEAMQGATAQLRAALDAQPPWSDLPFILLARREPGSRQSSDAFRARLFEFTGNAIVLERPLNAASLVSATASAMRARQKQFEMRDRLAERDVARESLEESENRLRLATNAAEIGFWDVDPATGGIIWPPVVRRMFGVTDDRPITMQDFLDGVHPDDRAATGAAFEAATDPAQRALYDVEYRTVGLNDGVMRWVAAKGRALFDANGVCTRVVGTAIDITPRKAAELELRSFAETLEERVRERTGRLMEAEAALRQSQKMEAVGQLTGGIAHDFNNMLTGVIGAMDVMKRRLAAGRIDDLDRFMDAASTSAQRAAALTARLLAFSRRQSLDARSIDVNALLISLEELLKRSISENVALRIVADDGAGAAVTDANQLESAILNLAINARDAMPDGGTLTIATRRVTLDDTDDAETASGDYVLITVTDTGVGMAPELVQKVFDPFFTTKPIGQGTGLGLSMVYGFVRQSGGHVRIDSQPGGGTTISLYLPASDGQEVADATPPAPPSVAGSGQTVLLVEDDDSVRLLLRELLAELSYRTLEAEDATGAIAHLTNGETVDLMVSDVGLPGMDGRQLAEVARWHRPDLPILFVTGYAPTATNRADFLGPGMAMIAKPFSMDELSDRIRGMLAPVPAQ